ncbi:uncharacterized protein LOC111642021 [Centruroides sculpturatus]|uniref:uncharacterized protein LOC111642021 n=1 Tax=Centruroides sculpturatus TaxID=218467 RepID=UPI000C6EDFE9|nr:uncharacterized protein LOC111642021 [Centruroides sculpturatus]
MARRNETTEEREIHLTLLQENYQRNRNKKTEEQLENYRETDQIRKRLQREKETSAQLDERRKQIRERINNIRLDEHVNAQLLETTVYAVRESRRGTYGLQCEAFHYNSTKNYNEHPSVVIGKMDQICKFCKAKKFRGETQSTCCSSGKIRLPALNLLAPEFLEIMNGETQKSKHFLQKIRSYNACFQMTSFGATAITEEEGFNPVFKVQGQVCHKIGSLLPLANETPKFLQIYFVGNEEDEVVQQLTNFTGLRRDIIVYIQRDPFSVKPKRVKMDIRNTDVDHQVKEDLRQKSR